MEAEIKRKSLAQAKTPRMFPDQGGFSLLTINAPTHQKSPDTHWRVAVPEAIKDASREVDKGIGNIAKGTIDFIKEKLVKPTHVVGGEKSKMVKQAKVNASVNAQKGFPSSSGPSCAPELANRHKTRSDDNGIPL
jgi:hypothetical protein